MDGEYKVREIIQKKDKQEGEEMSEICMQCECSNEVLFVNAIDDEFEICIFPKSRSVGRFRHIMKIIKDGTPYSDQIIIDQKNAKKLAKFINSQVKK